ncbi:MAG: imidazoleglycerol-phosphate dehydratase HisB [Nitrososphaeria archaeon]
MRKATITRSTKETTVKVSLNLDGKGLCNINTTIKYLDHMLQQLSVHSFMDLDVFAEGDLSHHIVEDVAIALGTAISEALGNRHGIKRFGHAIVPMDETLAMVAVDLVQRPHVEIKLELSSNKIEDIYTEDIPHFLKSFASSLQFTLHVDILKGTNNHHKVETIFKALALSLKEAWSIEAKRKGVPSSKGKM